MSAESPEQGGRRSAGKADAQDLAPGASVRRSVTLRQKKRAAMKTIPQELCAGVSRAQRFIPKVLAQGDVLQHRAPTFRRGQERVPKLLRRIDGTGALARPDPQAQGRRVGTGASSPMRAVRWRGRKFRRRPSIASFPSAGQ
jgi:hypothetical protein